jgi:hypothetical protein
MTPAKPRNMPLTAKTSTAVISIAIAIVVNPALVVVCLFLAVAFEPLSKCCNPPGLFAVR